MLDIGSIHHSEYKFDNDRSGHLVIAEAPGRMYFLGEHGEPNTRLMLSAAIDRYARVAVSLRKDNSLRFFAADINERKRCTLVNLKYKREDRWANCLKAAVYAFAELGFPVKGLNFTLAGNIPQQVDLASSTAIEIASAIALKGLFRARINERELAERLGRAHKTLFGSETEIVDYLIGLYARRENFLFIDESSLSITRIPSPFSGYRLFLLDSRVPRLGVEDELSNRQADTKKGLAMLSPSEENPSFRNFATADLMDSMGDLPEQIRRRSMHVVQEIRRVYDAVDALQRGDIGIFAKTVFHSHESLRDLYEVSCPELDWLVKRAQEIEGSGGSRMTGKGFGGCTYAIIRNNYAAEYKRKIEDYERIFGFHPVITELKIASGGRVVRVKGRVYADTAYK
jgi:galactokinase